MVVDRKLDKMLSLLVAEIERVEATRNGFGLALKQMKKGLDLSRFPAVSRNLVETKFVQSISPTSLAGLSIAGIDGGLARKRFRTMDLILTRAIAVIFKFGSKEGPIVDFYPDPFPEPVVRPVMLALPGAELDQIASLERIISELRVAITVIDEYHTDLVLVDGSLFYHPKDRPSPNSVAHEKFQETLALYRQLYTKAMKKNTTLVGIVKDSRSSRIAKILGDILPHLIRSPEMFELIQGVDYRWLLKISRDCDLLDTFLDAGERTFVFKYSSEIGSSSNALPDDLSAWASSIWVTYLKTASDDLPIRVEFLAKNDPKAEIAKLNRALAAVLPLSWQHPEYGLPTPILEADVRARITNNETSLVVDRLMALSGLTYTSLKKRRSRNPFGGY